MKATFAGAILALALGVGLVSSPIAAQSPTPRAKSTAASQKIDEEYTQADQGVPAGSADHDRARRSPAGVRHGARRRSNSSAAPSARRAS